MKYIIFTLLVAAGLQASTLDVIFYDNRVGTMNDATGTYTDLTTLPISASAGIASVNGLLYIETWGPISMWWTLTPALSTGRTHGPDDYRRRLRGRYKRLL